jgi:asparagine synthase (glutamine-hydrolysing)
MGAVFLTRDDGSPAAARRRARLEAAFTRQGFAPGRVLDHHGHVIVCYAPLSGGEPLVHADNAGNVIALAGTLFYRARHGSDALPPLLADMVAGRLDESALWGCFAVMAGIGGAVRVYTDRCGTFHLFRSGAPDVLCSSFLALAESLDTPAIDADGVYDYVFHGATHGGLTVLRGIRLLDSTQAWTFHATGPVARFSRPLPHPDHTDPALTLSNAVDRCLSVLDDRFAALARRGNLDTALSGGYDSRLILALLRRHGVTPALHVYGPENSADVRIAKAVCAAEGLDLQHDDKGRRPLPDPDAYADAVNATLTAFDGTPNDGAFETGADLDTRLSRCHNGRLALNGGGGEVFRNFFYLSDRPVSPLNMKRVFWSQYDPAAASAGFNDAAYGRRFAARLAADVGRPPDAIRRPLPRVVVEAVYPLTRCRWWMGRNASINARLGAAVTPFVDAEVLATTLPVPLRLKHHGRLQAALIARADPALAALPSAYGHAFDAPVPTRRIVADWATYLRPPWLRARIFRLRHPPDTPPDALSPARVARVLGGAPAYMPRFFRLDRLREPGQLNRAMTLELLFRRLDAA